MGALSVMDPALRVVAAVSLSKLIEGSEVGI